ncbi:transglutaminase family protein, partial [Neobacillus niacini]
LPVKRVDDMPGLDGPRWQTGPWFFRDERMYLVPGDSPMGYRLPLDSLPWTASADYPYLVERDPFAPRDALPDAAAMRARYAGPADAPRYLAGVHREASAQTVMQWRDDGAAASGRPGAVDPHRRPERFESAAWITRTALCVEVRNGILYLFMP